MHEEKLQLQKQLEKELLALKVHSEEEKQMTSNTEQKVVEMQRTIDTLAGQNQELILNHEVTVNQFTSKIKELEKEQDYIKELGEALKKSAEKMGQSSDQNEKVQSDNDQQARGRGFQRQPNTNQRKQQHWQNNAASRHQQDHAEKQRLHQEIQSLKSLTTRLQQENKQLKDSLQIQEQQTTTALDKKELDKKTEECMGWERKHNILTCTLQDLRKDQAGAVVKRTVDQACLSEQSVLELNV
ncbi:hypothetical protein WMY93_001320 [Mugilogobius chulae]|uniref:Uncharacterized protein n=1 Tax=Mugilogobius chulae TaxID=88201 RepID=A0AAW0Q4I3_9GOBI